MTYWTLEDFRAGLCGIREVGTSRAEVDDQVEEAAPAPIEPIPLETPLTDTLEADIREAYARLGGLQYLLKNPALLNKMLLRQAPAAAERRTLTFEDRRHMEMRFEMSRRDQPWVSPKRLSYQEDWDAHVATDIDVFAGPGPFFRQPAFVEAHEAYLAAKTAAEAAASPAQPTAAESAPTPLPEPPTPLRAVAAAAEKRDVRRDCGPRGNAKHR